MRLRVRSASTMQTSTVTCARDRRPAINPNSGNGEARKPEDSDEPLELREAFVIRTPDGREIEFEVVGLVEDEEKTTYAVCYSEEEDEFVVSDAQGNLLADGELAQEILDDFFALAEEGEEEEVLEDDREGKP